MNALQLCNEPVAFTVGGRTLHFRQLSGLRLEAFRQSAFLSHLYAQLAEAIAGLPVTLTADERAGKIRELQDAIPRGNAFVVECEEWIEKDGLADVDLTPLWHESHTDGLSADELREVMEGRGPGEINPIMLHVIFSPYRRGWSHPLVVRNTCRGLAEEYGYTPAQIAGLSDDQLFNMVPGLAEDVARSDAKAKYKGKGSLIPEEKPSAG